MRASLTWLVVGSLLFISSVATAGDLSGKWELQTMGSDRGFTVQQKGKKVVAHRVMWPEFEGERYKLEHLYRGKIRGKKISGDLLVREPEFPDYEVLRPFSGSIDSNDKIILDGLPLKRTGNAGAAPELPTPGKGDRRPSAPPRHGKAEPPATPTPPAAVAQAAPPPPAPPSAPPPADTAAPDESGAALFERIMGSPGMDGEGLFAISNRITLPDEGEELVTEGDRLFAKKRYAAALAKYEQAKGGDSRRVHLLHRMGRCHIELGQAHLATPLLRKALRLDPENAALRRAYQRSKRK